MVTYRKTALNGQIFDIFIITIRPYNTLRFKTCVGSENTRQSALGTLKSDLIPTDQIHFRKKSAKHLTIIMIPKVFNPDKKQTKCNIGRVNFALHVHFIYVGLNCQRNVRNTHSVKRA